MEVLEHTDGLRAFEMVRCPPGFSQNVLLQRLTAHDTDVPLLPLLEYVHFGDGGLCEEPYLALHAFITSRKIDYRHSSVCASRLRCVTFQFRCQPWHAIHASDLARLRQLGDKTLKVDDEDGYGWKAKFNRETLLDWQIPYMG